MKKVTILGLILLGLGFFSSVSYAAVNSFYQGCIERGYEVITEYEVIDVESFPPGIDYCVFPDNSKCKIKDFNNGICGQKFMTQNYCVRQGTMIWDENKCCPGLKPYIQIGATGQKTCEPVIKYYTPHLLLIIVGIVVVSPIYFLIKKRKRVIRENINLK